MKRIALCQRIVWTIVQASYFDFTALASSRAEVPFSTPIKLIPPSPGMKNEWKSQITVHRRILGHCLSFLLSFISVFFFLPPLFTPTTFPFFLFFPVYLIVRGTKLENYYNYCFKCTLAAIKKLEFFSQRNVKRNKKQLNVLIKFKILWQPYLGLSGWCPKMSGCLKLKKRFTVNSFSKEVKIHSCGSGHKAGQCDSFPCLDSTFGLVTLHMELWSPQSK